MGEKECDACEGEGVVNEYCLTCNGSGEGMADGTICRRCHGRGVETVECEVCDGTGIKLEEEE